MNKKIQSALISVFYKDGLEPIVKLLSELGVTIYSTGGTQTFIEKLGIKVVPVEDLTTYPSILGGRVKTLHPSVFGGILGKRDDETHVAEMKQYKIPEIDLVIVDLYPFEETVASGAEKQAIIEKIDIGGVSLIRAAAKNHKEVVILASKEQYGVLESILDAKGGATDIEDRFKFAGQAFDITSHYDTAIYRWFAGDDITGFKHSIRTSQTLRYGENPHQAGTFHGDLNAMFDKLNGKELSYNNLLDVDA